MTTADNPHEAEMREALDAEVREDEAVWDKARTEFDEFRKDQKGQPARKVEEALHRWLRHHHITLHDEEVTAKAAKISAGEAVELADVPSVQDVLKSVEDNPN
jgi:transposase-like protein